MKDMGKQNLPEIKGTEVYNFLKIETSIFKTIINYDSGATNVDGWQVTFQDVSNRYKMIFKEVRDSIVLSPTYYDETSFQHVRRLNAPFTNVVSEEIVGSGPFNISLLRDSQQFDFYFLYKSQLENLLDNNATHLYFSKAVVSLGSTILEHQNNSMTCLKVECVEGDIPIYFTHREMSPAPLFLLSPPCPPMWNSLYAGFVPPVRVGTHVDIRSIGV